MLSQAMLLVGDQGKSPNRSLRYATIALISAASGVCTMQFGCNRSSECCTRPRRRVRTTLDEKNECCNRASSLASMLTISSVSAAASPTETPPPLALTATLSRASAFKARSTRGAQCSLGSSRVWCKRTCFRAVSDDERLELWQRREELGRCAAKHSTALFYIEALTL